MTVVSIDPKEWGWIFLGEKTADGVVCKCAMGHVLSKIGVSDERLVGQVLFSDPGGTTRELPEDMLTLYPSEREKLRSLQILPVSTGLRDELMSANDSSLSADHAVGRLNGVLERRGMDWRFELKEKVR